MVLIGSIKLRDKMTEKLQIESMSIIDEATHNEIKHLEREARLMFYRGIIVGILMTSLFAGLLYLSFS